MNPTEMREWMDRDAATIVQLERQLRKLIGAAEKIMLDANNTGLWVHLADTIATAKAHLE